MRFFPASDRSLLVYLGEEIGLPAHFRVVALLNTLERKPIPFVTNVQPAYCSLLLTFDPLATSHRQLERSLRSYAVIFKASKRSKPRRIVIPVCYGGVFGPDLEAVARDKNLSPQQVIDLHSSTIYHSYFLGFAPGFAYLGDLPSQLATPRRATPRTRVELGSVGIAGRQTGVYPFATPGGWNLIGRTPVAMFRSGRNPRSLLQPGDEVQFRPISEKEFARANR